MAIRRDDTITLRNPEGLQVTYKVTDIRRGISVICSDPSGNYSAEPSLDGRDENGRISADWRDGIHGSSKREGYAVYTHDGYTTLGDGFEIVATQKTWDLPELDSFFI